MSLSGTPALPVAVLRGFEDTLSQKGSVVLGSLVHRTLKVVVLYQMESLARLWIRPPASPL